MIISIGSEGLLLEFETFFVCFLFVSRSSAPHKRFRRGPICQLVANTELIFANRFFFVFFFQLSFLLTIYLFFFNIFFVNLLSLFLSLSFSSSSSASSHSQPISINLQHLNFFFFYLSWHLSSCGQSHAQSDSISSRTLEVFRTNNELAFAH